MPTLITRGAMSAFGFGFGGGPRNPSGTWNPLDLSNMVLSNGNLTATSGGTGGVRDTVSHSMGKYYFEVTATTASSNYAIGVADSTWSETSNLGSDAHSAGYRASGYLIANSQSTALLNTSYTSGAVIGVAVDVGNHLIYWALNNVWQNSAVPSSGTGGIDYITTNAVLPAYSQNFISGNVATLNAVFTYSPPAGFSPW